MSKKKPSRAKVAGTKRRSHRLALPDEIARLEKELVGWTNGTYAQAEAARVRDTLREKRRQMAARKVGSTETLASMLAVADAAEGAAREAAVQMLATLGLTEDEVLQMLNVYPEVPTAHTEEEQPEPTPAEDDLDQLMAELGAAPISNQDDLFNNDEDL